MAFLNKQQKLNITAAIRQAETKTSGELVAVIARASDDYYYIPMLWAALLALFAPGLLGLFGVSEAGWLPVAVFILAALLFRLPPIKMRLIPRYVKQRRAALLAREQFLAQNLHHTEQRNGILFFVSIAEHYVEIMADKGINDVVGPGTWDQVIGDFIQHVKQGQVEAGFINAINTSTEVLAQHFPLKEGDVNELPNHLVELE